jgi:hypothetical protein
MPVSKQNARQPHVIWQRPLVTLTVIWLVCSLLLAVMGPFGSYLSMDFTGRLLYWSAVVSGGTYYAHFLRLGLLRLLGKGWHQRSIDIVMGMIFAAVYVPPLYFLSQYVTQDRAPYTLIQMFGFVLAVTAGLIVIREALGLHAPGLEPPDATGAGDKNRDVQESAGTVEPPPIIERLPEPARGAVWAISGSDHYVDVKTDAGSSSVLLRFSDALREVEPVPGQRVHRSHWVADATVARMRRDGKRHFVVLKTGDEVPVSRTYAQDVCERWGEAAE